MEMKHTKKMTEKFDIDQIDRSIIAELRKNGRASNQQIADRLKLTAATVSARIRRLEQANKLRVIAVSDFRAHGYNVLLEIAIEVENRPASHVARELAELSEVFAVHLVTGRYDIDILVVLHEFDELQNFMLTKMAKIQGIRSMVPAIAVDVIKYKFDIAPITPRAKL
jgi:Lrp/AsnC family transcriptional regulator for asnA, asnC and gidA